MTETSLAESTTKDIAFSFSVRSCSQYYKTVSIDGQLTLRLGSITQALQYDMYGNYFPCKCAL